jgi:DNA-binding NarL/FixJ family response regulator
MPTSDSITIWIVEDQLPIREGMIYLLEKAETTYKVETFACGEDAIEALNRLPKPNLLLLDLGLPGISGLETLVKIKKYWVDLKILIFTIFEDDKNIFEALRCGASGYILKKENPDIIMRSIEEVLHDGAPMSREIAIRVLKSFTSSTTLSEELDLLSDREMQVLEHLAKGLLNKEIADIMNISIFTVKNHIANIYVKLHVQNRSEAILKYLKNGH